MAHCITTAAGDLIWLPDTFTITERIKLLPTLTPLENLWRIIDIVSSVWLSKSHVHAKSCEDMEELEQSVKLATFFEFRRRVWHKQYNRNYSVYLNVRSCCWSVCKECLRKWFLRLERCSNEITTGVNDEDEVCPIYNIISSHEAQRLSTEYDCRHAKTDYKQYKQWQKQSYKSEHGRAIAALAVMRRALRTYLDDVAELGVRGVSEDEFIKKNYPDYYELWKKSKD